MNPPTSSSSSPSPRQPNRVNDDEEIGDINPLSPHPTSLLALKNQHNHSNNNANNNNNVKFVSQPPPSSSIPAPMLQRANSARRQQHGQTIQDLMKEEAERAKIEVSIFPKSEFWMNFHSYVFSLLDYLINEPVQCKIPQIFILFIGKFFTFFILIFLIGLFSLWKLGYHILGNINIQFIYLIYDYTNINLTSFSSFFKKPDLRHDLRKKMVLDDHNADFLWILYQINFMIKRYHFFMINCIMFALTTQSPFNYYISLDKVIIGININSKLYNFIQVVIAIVVSYLNFHRSSQLRKDLTSLLRLLTTGHFRVIDSNSTVLKKLDEIISDLKYFTFVHLKTDDEDDIILSFVSYREFNVGELRELLCDGEIFNGKKFRFIVINEEDFTVLEDLTLHIYFYSHVSILSKPVIFNITSNDLRIYDTSTVFVLFLYFFTSLDPSGYFNMVFLALIILFFIFGIARKQSDRLYSFGFYEGNQLKMVRNRLNSKLETRNAAIAKQEMKEFNRLSHVSSNPLIQRRNDSEKTNADPNDDEGEKYYSQNKYMQAIANLKFFTKVLDILVKYQMKTRSASDDESERSVQYQTKKVLIHFLLKTCYGLSYRFDRKGLRVHDFLHWLKDLAFHYHFSILISYREKEEYSYQLLSSGFILAIELLPNGDIEIAEKPINEEDEDELKEKENRYNYNFDIILGNSYSIR